MQELYALVKCIQEEVTAQPCQSKEGVSEESPKHKERTEVMPAEAAKEEQTKPPNKEATSDDDPAIPTFFSLEELHAGVEGIAPDAREQYLHPYEFEKIFGITRENFNEMRLWRRQELKKKVGLF